LPLNEAFLGLERCLQQCRVKGIICGHLKLTAVYSLCLLLVCSGLLGCTRQSGPPTEQSGPHLGTGTTQPAESTHSFIYNGPLPELYREAPMLAEQVRAGNLPPVAPNTPPLQNPGIARTETFFFE